MILIIKHIDIEGPGMLGEFFEGSSWKTKVVELSRGDTLPPADECEAIISLGGPMNVYEEGKCSFLKEEDKLLKAAIQDSIPVLGICLGAQLLAKACGAEVKKASQKESGWDKVSLTNEGRQEPLFEDLPAELEVFQWHEDTFDIPEGAAHLAESPVCRNQAFRSGRNAYGLQFHLEVTPQMVESWIGAYTRNETVETKNMIIDAYRKKDALGIQAQKLCHNFSRIIAASQKIRAG